MRESKSVREDCERPCETHNQSTMFTTIILLVVLLSTAHGSILSTGSHHFVANHHGGSLGTLAAPKVSVTFAKHEITTEKALTEFLIKSLGKDKETSAISQNFFEARAAKDVKMSFWVDLKVNQGQMDLVIITKTGKTVQLDKGTAAVSIPRVENCWDQCEKVKRFMRSPFTRCQRKCKPRGLTAGELGAVSAHLAGHLRNNKELSPKLIAVEATTKKTKRTKKTKK